MQSVKFTIEDLILDPAFIRWVKEPQNENGRIWLEWAALDGVNMHIVSEARDIVFELSRDEDAPLKKELDEVWAKVCQTNEAFDNNVRGTPKIGPIRYFSTGMRIAAAIIAFLVLSVLSLMVLTMNEKHTTDYAENKRIVLPDGSLVVLNSNSSVSYQKSWDDEEQRELWLDGEAFFSVVHKKNSQKFIVHAGGLDVQVLGTKFDVNTREGETRVILNSGKVKLFVGREQEKVIEMKPGELVDYSSEHKIVSKKSVVASKYNAWVDQKLVFDEASLKDIAKLLHDNYNYKVQILSPELENLTFTGTIESGDIDLLFTILQKTLNISITKKEGTIVIKPK